jgi:hypothetical protein
VKLIMPAKPSDWTPADEQGYQEALTNLKARMDAPGGDPEGLVRAEYTTLTDPQSGRLFYLKAKADGWL